jgi:hypothetical protein
MSSLIFATDSEQAFVATDTLAVSYNGEPSFFTTKAFIVPHLRMIIAGTGVTGLMSKWFVQVVHGMVVRGIEHLDYHTPENLDRIWRNMKEEFPIPDNFTTTIYHMGFSEEDGLMKSYAYRSTDNFESEQLPYSLRYKPECTVPENYALPIDIPAMMQDQRERQSLLPKEERLYIGGEILITHLTKDGFHSYNLCKFDDYDADEEAIYCNYGQNI